MKESSSCNFVYVFLTRYSVHSWWLTKASCGGWLEEGTQGRVPSMACPYHTKTRKVGEQGGVRCRATAPRMPDPLPGLLAPLPPLFLLFEYLEGVEQGGKGAGVCWGASVGHLQVGVVVVGRVLV